MAKNASEIILYAIGIVTKSDTIQITRSMSKRIFQSRSRSRNVIVCSFPKGILSLVVLLTDKSRCVAFLRMRLMSRNGIIPPHWIRISQHSQGSSTFISSSFISSTTGFCAIVLRKMMCGNRVSRKCRLCMMVRITEIIVSD